MPFTPSHAVVALAFRRTPLAPAAVAVGAMTPDLPLFLRGTAVTYAWTHDLRWLALTVVLALFLLLVWRFVLRPAVRELSPAAIAGRLPPAWDRGWAATARETFPSARGVLLLLAALAVGVATHVLWDLFTHEGRGGVGAIPLLAEMWGPLPGYRWLQYGSSVVGLAILGIWALLWLRRRKAASAPRVLPGWVRWVWWLSLPVVLAAAAVVGYIDRGPFTASFTPQHLAYAVLPPACALWGAASIVLCGVVQLRRRMAV